MPQGKPSKVEGYKTASRRLRGEILPGLSTPEPIFADPEHQLLKFHGIYQGYDRDTATALKQQGLSKEYEFMARVRIPAGVLSSAQYLVLDEMAQRYAGGRLRITTRQTIQFHGIAKTDLWAAIHGVNTTLLTTFGACGDVVRNVTASAVPLVDARRQRMRDDAALISQSFLPQTRAYHEIWVDGRNVAGDEPPAGEPVVDPLYGPTYLPRKFKIGIALPEDNDIDVLTNDLAIIPDFAGETLKGYTIAIGGGLGMTHNRPHTYPRIATPVAYVGPDELIAIIRAVVSLHRDEGDRTDRRHARLKYVVDRLGPDVVKAELDARFGRVLTPPPPLPAFQVQEHMGWHPQGDGKFYLGLIVASGRIEDKGDLRLATAFRRLMTEISLRPVLAASQDIFFADIDAADRPAVEAILRECGVALPGEETPLKRWALACPALPSCGLALNEAERVLDQITADIERSLGRFGLAGERVSLRITGCPNGCARPYTGDIGLVGRTPDTYAVYLGGDFEGTRLNQRVYERVKITDLGLALEPAFALWAEHRQTGEGFGNFCQRWGLDRLAALRSADGAEAAD